MTNENASSFHEVYDISEKLEADSNKYVDKGHNESKVFFWEKWASSLNEKEDKLFFYEVSKDPRIREVIRNFESRIIGKTVLFSDISTKNPSIKKWINKIRDNYPEIDHDTVEDLLNAFRDSLRTASKEKHKYIVGVLLLNNIMLLLHSKKESSLAELKNGVFPVDVVLNPKNVLRTAIIKNESGKTTFSVFEYSKRLRKGHADFWGIEPEDVSWDSLGNIFLRIELGDFKYPIQLPIDSEQLDEMIKEKKISHSGRIKMGREDGTIIKVEIFKRSMDFAQFYDFYITEKQKLEEYRKKFKDMMKATLDDFEDFPNTKTKYKYKDDVDKVFEINIEDNIPVVEKKHPRYNIGFFTKSYPRVQPSNRFVYRLYESIFENSGAEIWHAGEKTSHDPTKIGSLSVYNKIDANRDMFEFSDNLLNIIQDTISRKESLILQNVFCNFWKNNIQNKHFKCLFDFIMDLIIINDLEFEFTNDGILSKENYLEFKSADDIDAKPMRFAQKVANTVKGYLGEENPRRLCILYGIEDNGKIQPTYNRFKNDNAILIENKANELLKYDHIHVNIQPIPFKDGIVPAVFIIPII